MRPQAKECQVCSNTSSQEKGMGQSVPRAFWELPCQHLAFALPRTERIDFCCFKLPHSW